MNSFDMMTKYLTEDNSYSTKKVSSDKYKLWEKQWVFDSIKGLRLGQSFCEYFGIPNSSPLYYFKSNNFSEKWIKTHWIET